MNLGFVLFICVAVLLAWYLGWAIFIACATKGKITLRELLIEAFLVGSTVTEVGLPEYGPDWRERRKAS